MRQINPTSLDKYEATAYNQLFHPLRSEVSAYCDEFVLLSIRHHPVIAAAKLQARLTSNQSKHARMLQTELNRPGRANQRRLEYNAMCILVASLCISSEVRVRTE